MIQIHGKYMTIQKKRITKPAPDHKDIIGRRLKVGDYVAVNVYNRLEVAQVTKLNPKMVRIKILNAKTNQWYTGEHNRYPVDMAILDSEYLTFYLIKNSI